MRGKNRLVKRGKTRRTIQMSGFADEQREQYNNIWKSLRRGEPYLKTNCLIWFMENWMASLGLS